MGTKAAFTAVMISSLVAASTSASAQGTKASGPDDGTLSPKLARGAVKPAAPSGFNGPLAAFAAPLADKGITFHLLALDFVQGNPSVGIQPGHASHVAYIVEGVDIDLTKLWGMPGTSLHYENFFFAGVRNLNLAPEIGDVNTGYPPPFTPRCSARWGSRSRHGSWRPANGVLGMAEIGIKTDLAIDPYPYKASLTGFINTSNHADLNATTALTGFARTQNGTSGVVLQAEKTVWRQDGGADAGNATPTAIKLYGSAGTAIDSTIPIQSDLYAGATLMSPFAGRPADRFGVKVDWLRLNNNYAQYLSVAKTVAGGNTSPYNRDTFVFEANAHIQLPLGIGFEPVFDYTVHPTSFYNPTSAVKAKNGVYLGSTVVVPLGVIFGLASAS